MICLLPPSLASSLILFISFSPFAVLSLTSHYLLLSTPSSFYFFASDFLSILSQHSLALRRTYIDTPPLYKEGGREGFSLATLCVVR